MAIGEKEGVSVKAQHRRCREHSRKHSFLPFMGTARALVGNLVVAVFAGSRAGKRSRLGLVVSVSVEHELREVVPRTNSVMGWMLWQIGGSCTWSRGTGPAGPLRIYRIEDKAFLGNALLQTAICCGIMCLGKARIVFSIWV